MRWINVGYVWVNVGFMALTLQPGTIASVALQNEKHCQQE
jgi:hypothetical protein